VTGSGAAGSFLAGLTLFTLASAAAALSSSAEMLIIARALQGIGGAAVMPLSLTLLSASVPATAAVPRWESGEPRPGLPWRSARWSAVR